MTRRRGADRARRGGARRHLDLRGHVWWFKREVPSDLRSHYGGKRTILESTGTRDLREAQRIRDELEAQTSAEFATLRSGGTIAGAAPWTPAEQGRIMREELAKAERQDPSDWRRVVDLSFAAEAVEAELKGKPQRAAYLNALHGHEAADAFVDAYAAYRKDLREKTVYERRGIIRQFAEWAAKDELMPPEINRRVAGRYVSEKLEAAGRHSATARKHLTALSDYWTFLLARGHVTPPRGQEGNPWTGQLAQGRGTRRSGNGVEPEERAFTDDEVKALLYGPAKDSFTPAFVPDILDMLRVSLLSGLRLDEAVRLTAGDVQGGAIRVVAGKTAAAARTVPMHPDLKLIFTRRAPDGSPASAPVFPDLHRLARPGDTFGKRFRRYREAAGVKEDREGVRRSLVNFHSARRWFAQQARHNGHPLETIKEVMGHVADRRDRVTLGYTGAASDDQKRALVESLRLPSE